MFESQSGENQGAFTQDNLIKLADQLGLKGQDFKSCLESGKYADVVNSQTKFSQSIGVQSTPSFLINGRPVVGAQGYDVFVQYIEEELKK